MKPKRRAPTRDERQAAAYLMIMDGTGKPIVSREEAKGMTPREIVEAFERRVDWHHGIEHAIGGSMHPTNLEPLSPEDHKVIPSTARVAKAKRISRDHEEFRKRILAKSGQAEAPPRKTKKGYRPMAGTKASGMKKTMLGKVVRRG